MRLTMRLPLNMAISRNQFQNFLLILSLYVVVELYVSTLVSYSEQTKNTLQRIDFAICMIFLGDFFFGLYKAKDKWLFLRYNWIDFVSSIPTVGALRAGRVVKIIRILRVARSAKQLFVFFSKRNSFSTLKNLIIMNAVVILLLSFSFYELEGKENPAIGSIQDAVWWTTYTTITVGFLQDIPPVTLEGKVLSIVLVVMGMIMFSTMIGTITDYFIEDEDIQDRLEKMSGRVDDLEGKLDRVLEKLDEISNKKT